MDSLCPKVDQGGASSGRRDGRCQIADQGAEATGNESAEFAAFIASETERFGKIVKAVGVNAE